MTLTAPPVGPRYAPPELVDEPATPERRRRSGRLRGDPADPSWVRPAVLALLAATAVLYLWGLGASGWANSFYSAAAQAGSQSWKALFFGSSDASNFITVDKPPAALWVMGLSVRLFGLSSWSILVPEALMGVASVGVLYLTVKRWFGAGAGLLAGAVLALTPVATLMFRFNNPDAMLTLVLVIGAYCLTRALEDGRGRWLYAAFALVGLGFLTKSLQAVLVLPAFGLVYLVAAPTHLRRRIGQLAIATAAFVASFGWWVAIVELLPASLRPYIGGSQDNSELSLIFGYNGFGRLTGNETGSVGGGGGAPGAPGRRAGRLGARRAHRPHPCGDDPLGWLVAGDGCHVQPRPGDHPPVLHGRPGAGARRADRDRRCRVVAAPARARRPHRAGRDERGDRLVDAATAAALVIFTGVVGAIGVLVAPSLGRGMRAAVLATAIVGGLAAPAAASVATAATAHSGAIPSASPQTTVGLGGFGGGPGGRFGGGPPGGQLGTGQAGAPPTRNGGGFGGGGGIGGIGGILQSSQSDAELTAALQADAGRYTWVAATIGANQAAGYQLASQEPVMAIGGFNGSDPWPTLAAFQQYVANGQIHYFIAGGGGPGGGNGTASAISAWVEATFTATTIGATTVYDLTT
jgi:4-amino-4-deoxy-L-arabinose transferase-like glycosyltransferase